MPEHDGFAFADVMAILAQNNQYANLFRQIFYSNDGSGKPLFQGGDTLATVLGSIQDEKTRSLLASYAGESLAGHRGEAALDNILSLAKSAFPNAKEEFSDLQARLECISLIPSIIPSDGRFSHLEGNGVHLALSLAGEGFKSYQQLLRTFQKFSPEDLRYTAYHIIGALAKSEYPSSSFLKVTGDVLRVLAVKDGLKNFNDVLSIAIESKSPQRVAYVADIAEAVNNHPDETYPYFATSVALLVRKFVYFSGDSAANRLLSETHNWIQAGIKEGKTCLDSVEYLASNHASNHDGLFGNQNPKQLSEEQLADRTVKAIRSIMNLDAQNPPKEVYVAYAKKGGTRVGIEKFCEVAALPAVADTFHFMEQRSAPASAFKRLDTGKRPDSRMPYKPNEDGVYSMIEGMRVIGSDQVIQTLSRYSGRKFRSPVAVFVNVLYHNPELADGWSLALNQHRDEIAQMSPEHRNSIKNYFGVRNGDSGKDKKMEYFPDDKISISQFQEIMDRWITDYKAVSASK